MSAPLSTTRKELVDGFAAGKTVVQEEWAHPQEIAWVDELIAEGKAKPAHWQYFEEFQCERRSVTGVKVSTKILTDADAAGFSLGDIVETVKGAAFWGRLDQFYKGGTGAVVVAIAPGFKETTHVYPLAQLRRRRATAHRLVILESPYAGDVEANVAYARLALHDALSRGEAPIASHLLYTQPGVLDDAVPAQRELGINAGLAWGAVAQATVVYIDRGISSGMAEGIDRAMREGRPVEYRSLDAPSEDDRALANFDRIQHTFFASMDTVLPADIRARADRLNTARDLIRRLQSPQRQGCWCWPSRDIDSFGHEPACQDATAFLAEAVK